VGKEIRLGIVLWQASGVIPNQTERGLGRQDALALNLGWACPRKAPSCQCILGLISRPLSNID
jgi:hypothetical protein